MPMTISGQAGPSGPATSGQQVPVRLGALGDVIASELHAQRYEGTFRKNRFSGGMQAVLATATVVGPLASVTGVSVLANPNGSQVNLVLEEFGVSFVLAPAAPLAFGIGVGQSTTALAGTLTSLAPTSDFVGSGLNPVGLLYASAAITLPTVPYVKRWLGQLDQGAVTVTNSNQGVYDLKGSIIIPPGGYAVMVTSAVLAASAHVASWAWEEVSIVG